MPTETELVRPAPAIGQRWKVTGNAGGAAWAGREFTIDRPYPDGGGWCHTPGSPMYWPDRSFTNGDLTFLGYAPGAGPPTREGMAGVVVMGERDVNGIAMPVACLSCGLACKQRPGWICVKCSPVGERLTQEQWNLWHAWAAGARDFPRALKADSPKPDSGESVVTVGPARPAAQARMRCDVAGCDEVAANLRALLCERHIASAMVFSDGCRLRPALFPVIPEDEPSRVQSHLLGAGCIGIVNLRGR